eukprot:gene20920-27116_t
MERTVFIGSFSNEITRWSFNQLTNRLTYITRYDSVPSPSYLQLSYDKKQLFATNEVNQLDSELSGGVSVFSIDINHDLIPLHRVICGGLSPTHLTIHNSTIYVANYGSGSLSLISIDDASSETRLSKNRVISHRPETSESVSHVHQTVINNNDVFVVDLGLDYIKQYKLSNGLVDNDAIHTLTLPHGCGPRHMAIVNSNLAFVLCELSSIIIPLISSPLLQIHPSFPQVSSLPNKVDDLTDMAAGEIVISTDSRFIYVSNRDNSIDRGRDSIGVFEIKDSGLTAIQHVYSLGKHPRHFTILQDDNISRNSASLLVANKDSPNLSTFTVNLTTGLIDESSGQIFTSNYLIEPTYVLIL